MPRHDYLSLVNVDVKENKWRMYMIQTIFPDAPGTIYIVVCSWGRLNGYRRSKTNRFEKKDDMEKYLNVTLKKRCKNGYEVIDKSESFPESPTLLMLPATDNIAGQRKLF